MVKEYPKYLGFLKVLFAKHRQAYRTDYEI
jgi:hypothetical protein